MASGNLGNRGLHSTLTVLAMIAGLAALIYVIPPLRLIVTLPFQMVCIPFQMAKIKRVEERMHQPETYMEVATNLALYCQSVHDLQITNMLRRSRLPQPIPQLGDAPIGMFESNHAHVAIGGKSREHGYKIMLDESASSPQSNVWELLFVGERRGKMLYRFALDPRAQVPPDSPLMNSVAR